MREIRRYGYALLQVVNRLVLKVDLLGAVDVGSVSENADGHAGAGDVGQPRRGSIRSANGMSGEADGART